MSTATSTEPKPISYQITEVAPGSAAESAESFRPLQPDAAHLRHLLHWCSRAVLRHVRQAVPMRIIEIDDVDRRNAGVVERHVVVLDGVLAEAVLEGAAL